MKETQDELKSLREGSGDNKTISKLKKKCKDRNNNKSVECCKISLNLV